MRGTAAPVWRRLVAVLAGTLLGLSLLAGTTRPDGTAVAGEAEPPQTAIVRHPVDPTTSRRAIFEHVAYPFGSTWVFECRLDRRKWKGCSIEAKYKGLSLGRHVFRVRAVDDGLEDPTPARFRWRIVASQRG